MKTITSEYIKNYVDEHINNNPFEYAMKLRDKIVKENQTVFGLIEYLRLKFALCEQSIAIMCAIIRFVLLQQANDDEINFMIDDKEVENNEYKLVVSDEIVRYVYDQFNNNFAEFINMVLENIAIDNDENFTAYVNSLATKECEFINDVIMKTTPDLETNLLGYIPVFSIYDTYKSFLEKNLKKSE